METKQKNMTRKLAVEGNGSLSGNILITALERGGVFSQLFPEQGKQAR